MNEAELALLVTTHLDKPGEIEKWSMRSGSVLYSDISSVRPGRFYVLGINPGGQEDSKPESAIVNNLAAPSGKNCYADECWYCDDLSHCYHLRNDELQREARMPLQHRVCDLIESLHAAPADVLGTNLIFARSPELSKLRGSKSQWKRRCWDVHCALLRVVRPEWIVTLGFGEVFSSLQAFGDEVVQQESITHGGKAVAWHRRLRLNLGNDDQHEVGVLGVAHPSDRGFNRAGLSGTRGYPDALKRFIDNRLLAGGVV